MKQVQMTLDGVDEYKNTTGGDEWITPKKITDELGPFHLDPCAPANRPWNAARRCFTEKEDGLAQEWKGRVWLNPPYGQGVHLWLERMAKHGNGIALLHSRTDTDAFHRWVWGAADALYWIRGRIKFCDNNGKQGGQATAPSVLIAYGKKNADILAKFKTYPGHLQLNISQLKKAEVDITNLGHVDGKAIRDFRRYYKHRLTQQQLADIIFCKRASISRAELGNRAPRSVILKLAILLEVADTRNHSTDKKIQAIMARYRMFYDWGQSVISVMRGKKTIQQYRVEWGLANWITR